MKINVYTMKQQAQDFLLRLFIEPDSQSNITQSYYTSARCGTFARKHM